MTTILPSDKPNALITGAAGFIGTHLIKDLLEKDYHVIAVDNFITGSEKNIDPYLQNPNFEFIRHDMTEPLDFTKFPELKKFKAELQGVQEIYHLSCPTSPKEYNKFPIETLKANSHATFNVLELARQYQAKLLFFSSASVYGDINSKDPVKEDNHGNVNPIGPRSCYNEGKRFAESLVMNYHLVYGLDTKIVRVFNTFGPNMKLDDGRMIPDFILSALNNKPLTIYGTEEDAGSYCYIDDMIEAFLRLIKSEINTPVNLGSMHEVRLVDIAKLIIELTGSTSEIKFSPPLAYSANQLIPDITLAKEQLDWFPIVSLEEGLQKTIEYMKVNAREYQA
ncbi:MAG TPA: NAD-dependent epimerase/dehydratase family protein [bacterium]|nr:NAD-dependent epimerase/dehydratase family protein [bacterium]